MDEQKNPTARTLHSGQYLRLCREGHWEYVERHTCRGAVMILPLTAANEVILVEQYRVPLHASVIEWPAGLVGDLESHRQEASAVCAQRELLEETGYHAARLEPVFQGPVSAGLSSEQIEIFVALDLTQIHAGGGEPGEGITVHRVPLATIDNWLATQAATGKLIDVKLAAGLYWLGHVCNID
ncbi:MAG: NUDIX hydrolase [Deltaproteobacteria bacterium]|nr:NUDIX hydrolase [Deltaproteobacteria bacterium]